MVNSRSAEGSMVAGWTAAAATALIAAGCSVIFGFERSDVLVQCIHNSDCAKGLVCLEGTCTTACTHNTDCQGLPGFPPGLVCRLNTCVPGDEAGTRVAPRDASSERYLSPESSPECGDTTEDVNNCGWCGHACVGTNVSWKCVASKCFANGCQLGWGDCDGDPSNGCETDLTGSPVNCGSCQNPEASVCESDVCENGVCAIADQIGKACVEGGQDQNQPLQFPANTIAGAQAWSGSGGRITAIGINTSIQNAVQHAYLAIYTDSPAGPTERKFASDAIVLTGGAAEVPVAHTPTEHIDLDPQTYFWITVVSGDPIAIDACSGASKQGWSDLPFGPPPAALSNPFNFGSQALTPSMYIKIAHPR